MTTRAPDTSGTQSTSEPSTTSITSAAAERASGVADTARAEARGVTEAAESETRRLASEARRELHDQSEAQTHRVAAGIRDLGRQAQRLVDGDGPVEGPVADLVREVAQRADALATRLDDGGIDRITGDLKQLARRRPGMFLAGAFAVGIVAGRIIRNVDTHSLVEAARLDAGDGNGGRTAAATGSGEAMGSVATTTPATPSELTTPTVGI